MKKLISLFVNWIIARVKDPKTYVALFVVSGFCDATIEDGFVTKANAQTCVYTGSTQRQLAQFCDIENSMSYSFTGLTVTLNDVFRNAAHPTQSGNSGRFLTTNGTTLSWGDGFALPSQTGNAGKPLITNGTTPSWGKKQEIFSGTTNGSGLYTVTFSGTYSVAPNVQVAIQGDFASYTAVVSSKNTTTATVKVYTLSSILSLGLVPQYSTVASVPVDVVITEK